jgi:hypothetical protein
MIKQGSFAYSCDSVRLLNRRKLFLRGVGLRPVQVLPGNTDRGQIFTLVQRDIGVTPPFVKIVRLGEKLRGELVLYPDRLD